MNKIKSNKKNAFLFLLTLMLVIFSSSALSYVYTPRNDINFIIDEEKSGCTFSGIRASCGTCKSNFQLDCAYYFYENPKDCVNLGNNRNFCVRMIHTANLFKNDKIKETCSYTQGEDWVKDDCILGLLKNNLESITDVKYCKLIDEEDFRRAGCIKDIVLNQSTKKGDAQYCDDISDEFSHIRTDCYREMALKYDDPKTCGSIDTSTKRILSCCLEVKYPEVYQEYSSLGFGSEALFDFYEQNVKEIEDCKSITDLAGPEIITFCEKLNCDCTKPLNELTKTDSKLAEKIAVECVIERYECYMEHRTLSHPELDEAVSIQGFGGWNRQHCHRMFDFPSLDGLIDWSKWSSWVYVPEPKYPLYDIYFDYDGDGMLNEYEYQDYLMSQIVIKENFDEVYPDSDKIEYMDDFKMPNIKDNEISKDALIELEKQINEGEEVTLEIDSNIITRFHLPDLFSQVNMYESELLKMSESITYEVSTIAEEIDMNSKTIVNLNKSLSQFKEITGSNVEDQLESLKKQAESLEGTYFRRGKLDGIKEKIHELESNKDTIQELERRIELTKEKIRNNTKRQTELINIIDEEYRVLISKFDEDIKNADGDFTAMPMRNVRTELIENAQYAKVKAYFHSGNTKEFERLANRLKISNNMHGSEIAILLGLKKLEKGDPQSALHDFKEAMAINPNNAVAREITNKVETNYLSKIEDRLMNELEGDRKRYESSVNAGGSGAFNVMKDILTTGIGSSTGALFGYEEAKAIESGILQTEASKQIAGIKISKALMGDGMTIKELYDLKKPEDIQKLARERGRELTKEQAKEYRGMIHAALNNNDISNLKQNRYYPLEIDSHNSYFSTNYNPGLTTQVLDLINVKNVLITLGPSSVVGVGAKGKTISAKSYIRDATGLSGFQKAVLSGNVGSSSGNVGKLFATASARLGRDLNTISKYGYVRQFAIKQGFSYLEGKAVEGTAKTILGNNTGAIFTDLYKGVAAFTGFNDLGDMIEIAENMDVKDFDTRFRYALKEGSMDKSDLVKGKGIVNEKHRISNQAKEITTDSTSKVLERSIDSKKTLEYSELSKLKQELARQTKDLQDTPALRNTKAAFLKQSELDSVNSALVAYENGNLDIVQINLEKAKNMQRLLDKEISELAVQKEIAEYLYRTAENLNVDEKVSSITDLIKEKPLNVGKLNVPESIINIDGKSKSIGGQLDIIMEFGNTDKGWQKIIDGEQESNVFKIVTAIAPLDKKIYETSYKTFGDEFESLSLKAIEKAIGDLTGDAEKLFDKASNEFMVAITLPDSNKFAVKIQQDSDDSSSASVTNAFILREEIYQKYIENERYIILK